MQAHAKWLKAVELHGPQAAAAAAAAAREKAGEAGPVPPPGTAPALPPGFPPIPPPRWTPTPQGAPAATATARAREHPEPSQALHSIRDPPAATTTTLQPSGMPSAGPAAQDSSAPASPVPRLPLGPPSTSHPSDELRAPSSHPSPAPPAPQASGAARPSDSGMPTARTLQQASTHHTPHTTATTASGLPRSSRTGSHLPDDRDHGREGAARSSSGRRDDGGAREPADGAPAAKQQQARELTREEAAQQAREAYHAAEQAATAWTEASGKAALALAWGPPYWHHQSHRWGLHNLVVPPPAPSASVRQEPSVPGRAPPVASAAVPQTAAPRAPAAAVPQPPRWPAAQPSAAAPPRQPLHGGAPGRWRAQWQMPFCTPENVAGLYLGTGGLSASSSSAGQPFESRAHTSPAAGGAAAPANAPGQQQRDQDPARRAGVVGQQPGAALAARASRPTAPPSMPPMPGVWVPDQPMPPPDPKQVLPLRLWQRDPYK